MTTTGIEHLFVSNAMEMFHIYYGVLSLASHLFIYLFVCNREHFPTIRTRKYPHLVTILRSQTYQLYLSADVG